MASEMEKRPESEWWKESFQNTLIPCRPKPFFPPASLSHTSDEVLKELLKMRDQLEELFAGLSLEENFQTSRPLDNRWDGVVFILVASSSFVPLHHPTSFPFLLPHFPPPPTPFLLSSPPGRPKSTYQNHRRTIDIIAAGDTGAESRSRGGRAASKSKVLEQLLSLKHFLDMLNNLIESFDPAAEADSALVCLNNALQFYHRRRAEGMPASTVILNFLLAISTQVDHNKSMELYALMLKEGLQPDFTTIGCLCLSACFAGDIISIKRSPFVSHSVPVRISLSPRSYLTQSPFVSHSVPVRISLSPRSYLTQSPFVSHSVPIRISLSPRSYLTQSPFVSHSVPVRISLSPRSYLTQSPFVSHSVPVRISLSPRSYLTQSPFVSHSVPVRISLSPRSYLTQSPFVSHSVPVRISLSPHSYLTQSPFVSHSVPVRISLSPHSYLTQSPFVSHSVPVRISLSPRSYLTQSPFVSHSVPVRISLSPRSYLTQSPFVSHSVPVRISLSPHSYLTQSTFVSHSVPIRISLSPRSYLTQSPFVSHSFPVRISLSPRSYLTQSPFVSHSVPVRISLSPRSYLTQSPFILLDSAGWEDQENHEDEEEDFLSSTTLYYNKFIDLCAASDSQANAGDHEGALQAYKLMSASGFARDLEPELWNKLIHAVAAVPSAPAYVAYGPDLDTYVGLMAVCARDGDAAWAMALRREMEDGGVEVTGEVLRALMAMQRKAGMWEAAVETFKEMQTKAVLSTDEDAAWGREFLKEAAEKVRPNAKTLNLLIEASVEAGYHEGAVRAYKLMAANGLAHELNPVFWSKLTQFARTVIAPSTPTNTANEADTPPPVLQLLSEATESGCVDPEVFNLLIETSLQAGDHEGALRAYKLMSANGLASDLDPPFWNKLILAVAAVPSAPAYVAYGCYEGMKRWGPTPDPETYQGLMAVCARDGDAARAMALKKDMQDGGVEVTAAVLHALLTMQRQAGLSEAAVKTLKEMQAKAVLSTDEQKAWGCELLTEAIEKGDAARATALRREVADGDVEVTGEVLRALMAMQRQAGMWEAVVESLKEMQAKAILLTDEDTAWGRELLMEAIEKGSPDAETFNLAIAASLEAGDPEGALRAYKLMSASGFACDLDPPFWNKLIHAVAAVPSAPAFVAYGCYEGMKRWGPTPDPETYQGLMAVCARDGDAARAMALKKDMQDGGVEVTAAVLHALLAMQRQAGLSEAAVKTLKEMQAKAGLSTDEQKAWGCELLTEAIEKGDAARATALRREVADGDVEVTGEVLRALMAMQRQAGMWEAVVESLKEMQAKAILLTDEDTAWGRELLMEAIEKGSPDAETFNLAIAASLEAGDPEGALRAYKLMSASGFACDLDPPFWNKLIHAVAAVPSAPAFVAYGCYEGMKRWGPTPDPETYQGLMAVCARDGDAARAMALKKDMQDGGVEVTAAVLHALLAMQRQAGLSEAAVKTLKEMQAKAGLSTDEQKAWGCELLTEAIEKGDAARATALRREVADGDVEVTGEVLRALMAMQRQAGMWEAVVESLKEMQAKAILLTDEDTAWGRELLMEAIEKGSPDAETFNLAIAASLEAGDPEGALRAYKLMSASGFACDLDPPFWNKLIHAVAAVPSAPAFVAYGCYDGMQRWGPEPDEATYQGLMAVCARDGDAARAIALRREMEDGGVEVTAVVYTALINAQGRAGEWEAAVETFNEMQGSTKGEMEHPHQPSMDTYTRLFDACFGPDGADPVIRDAMQEGKTLKFTPALQAAVSIFREAAAKGVFPPALTADPFTLYVVDCTRPVAAAALLSLLLRLASSSTAGCNDASWLQNLSQAADEAPPQEPCPDLQGTMEAMLQALGLKGERLHGTSALQGLCVDREDLRLWLNTQAASVFLA
ncbi:unnamed protein product [Closterium sp. NIES-65]|nr:unnamed protein product [Closterium sp. NIES-65]